LKGLAELPFFVNVLTITEPKILVHWDWPSGVLRQNFQLQIFSGESEKELKAASGIIDGSEYNEYIDYTPIVQVFDKRIYYAIQAKEKQTGLTSLFGPTSWFGEPELESIYVVEEHEFLFRDTTGVPSFISIRKTEGAYCEECFDKISKKRIKSHCLTCYGTNFHGGFYRPYLRYIDYSPDPKIKILEMWGEREPTEVDVFLTSHPSIRQGDLITEALPGRRYRVKRVSQAEKRRTPLLQLARCEQIPRGDIEYEVPIRETEIVGAVQEFEKLKKERGF
jgi:hypothetical protein